jgi:hypothetical protein
MSAKRRFPRGQANFRARPRGEAPPRVPSLARRVRITMIVLAVALIGLGAGALPSLAAPGRVYFDDDDNVAAGENLFNESFTGAFNVGLGRRVMPKLTSGGANVAVGHSALHDNTRGNDNIATGLFALASNTRGQANVATGSRALLENTTGHDNLATGFHALSSNTTGFNNLALGNNALGESSTAVKNVAVGHDALKETTGSANVALGSGAGRNLTNGVENVDIAHPGVAGESGAIRIGTVGDQTAAFMAGISGTSVAANAQPVLVSPNGKLGTAPARSDVATPLASTIRRLESELRRQQRQIDRLRERVRGG